MAIAKKTIISIDFNGNKVEFYIYGSSTLFYFKTRSKRNQGSGVSSNIHENDSIRENLNYPPHIYYEIISKNNGIYRGKHVEYYDYFFNSVSDIENVISELESYAIMQKLVE